MMQMEQNRKLSYEIWEKEGKCPHCGNEDFEYTFGENNEYIECPECGNESAEEIVTPEEEKLREEIDNMVFDDFEKGV